MASATFRIFLFVVWCSCTFVGRTVFCLIRSNSKWQLVSVSALGHTVLCHWPSRLRPEITPHFFFIFCFFRPVYLTVIFVLTKPKEKIHQSVNNQRKEKAGAVFGCIPSKKLEFCPVAFCLCVGFCECLGQDRLLWWPSIKQTLENEFLAERDFGSADSTLQKKVNGSWISRAQYQPIGQSSHGVGSDGPGGRQYTR